MSLNVIAEEYFRDINSMANRMCTDMEETKLQHKHSWHKLKEDEKNKILNDCIIKPQLMFKYGEGNDGNNINHNYKNYATKIVVDDNCSYQDEHSGPFSFHSKSQRDLTHLYDKKVHFKNPTVPKDETMKSKGTNNVLPDNLNSLTSDNLFCTQTLPRTGLDLLDNW